MVTQTEDRKLATLSNVKQYRKQPQPKYVMKYKLIFMCNLFFGRFLIAK